MPQASQEDDSVLRTASLPVSAAAPSLPGSHLAGVSAASVSPVAQSPHAQARRTEVTASCLATGTGRLAEAPSSSPMLTRPAKPDHCLEGCAEAEATY